MAFWNPKKNQRHETEAQDWARRRRDELSAFLENLDAGLADVSEKMRLFRQAHCTFDRGKIVYVSDSMFDRVRLEQEWRDLMQHRDSIRTARNSVLAELAELKTLVTA